MSSTYLPSFSSISLPQISSVNPLERLDHFFRQHSKELEGVLRKVSALALSAFACFENANLYLFGLGSGIVLGLVFNDLTSGKPIKGFSACAGGNFVEDFSGVRSPWPVALVVDFLFKFAHLEHHPDISIPLAGFGGGLFIAKLAKSFASSR